MTKNLYRSASRLSSAVPSAHEMEKVIFPRGCAVFPLSATFQGADSHPKLTTSFLQGRTGGRVGWLGSTSVLADVHVVAGDKWAVWVFHFPSGFICHRRANKSAVGS